MRWPSFSFHWAGGGWGFGVSFRFENCGCKHIDLLLYQVVIRMEYGVCRTVPVNPQESDEFSI